MKKMQPTAKPVKRLAGIWLAGSRVRRTGPAISGSWLVLIALVATLTGLTLTALTPAPALAAASNGKYALVIGNSNYANVSALDNPLNDARAISAKLRKLGFTVLGGTDLTYVSSKATIKRFFKAARDMKVGLFFYAGHGVQIGGENYMIPVDADFSNDKSAGRSVVSIKELLSVLDTRSKVGIVYLDACRDNPFDDDIERQIGNGRFVVTRSLGRIGLGRRSTRTAASASGRGTRGAGSPRPSVGRGLAKIDGGVGMHIAFATRPGDVAADGVGRHSPFTAGLLKYMDKPGLVLEAVDKNVRKHVVAVTGGKQIPWGQSSLADDFYFVRPIAAPAAPARRAPKRKRRTFLP